MNKRSRLWALLIIVILTGVVGYYLILQKRAHVVPLGDKADNRTERLLQFLKVHPDIFAVAQIADTSAFQELVGEVWSRAGSLNLLERTMLAMLGKEVWVASRQDLSTDIRWTWMLMAPMSEALMRSLLASRAFMPRTLQWKTVPTQANCRNAFTIVGVENAWGESIEFQYCPPFLVIGPELFSWQDLRTQLQEILTTLPKHKGQDGHASPEIPLLTAWVHPNRISSETLSPIFGARTAAVARFLTTSAPQDQWVVVKLRQKGDDRVTFEVDSPWPPFHIPK